MTTVIELKNIVKRFADITAIDDVSLEIRDNEYFALLGPSGCGKTTLLRSLAGFEIPDSGQVVIGGEDYTRVPPRRRPLNLMFQSYALFPHMTVEKNIAYGLEMEKLPRDEIDRRVAEVIRSAKLEPFAKRRPDQLSGGQRQRVALARALVKRPRVLLLDEPLSALDKKLREEMQLELKRLQHEVGVTFLMVTHDQDEALVMADRVAVLNAGRIAQVGTPHELYEFPQSRFVADFIGIMNFLPGKAAGKTVEVDGVGILRGHGEVTGDAVLAVRPERVSLLKSDPGDGRNAVIGRIHDIAYHGSEVGIHVKVCDGRETMVSRVHASEAGQEHFRLGSEICCVWDSDSSRILANS